MEKILVIHGPNLGLLGKREVSVYGTVTIDQINSDLKKEARPLRVALTIVQSNHEGEIIDLVGGASPRYSGILINPAAYTHTSVAIRDALSGVGLPAVEVHLSNIYKREEFRHKSLTAPAVVGQVSGFGRHSYVLGLAGLVGYIRGMKKRKK